MDINCESISSCWGILLLVGNFMYGRWDIGDNESSDDLVMFGFPTYLDAAGATNRWRHRETYSSPCPGFTIHGIV